MNIGIQGGPASYHEAAAMQLRPNVHIAYHSTFTDLFAAIKYGKVDSGLAAIANNRVQFIPDSYEYLTAADAPYQVVGEVYLRIEHALLAPKGATLQSITQVHSQAPALGQCSHFLEKTLPLAHPVEEADTALAAEVVAKEGDITKAAIASKKAGELHGLTVLQEAVQDDPDNITRFLEIRLKSDTIINDNANKTTLMLQTPQIAGSLVDALLPFKQANINLSSLQSKLIPNSSFDMEFFVEFDAGLQEDRTKQVLNQLTKDGYGLRVLGSYQQAIIPISKGK